MKRMIKFFYLLIYNNVKGESKVDKIESTNLQLTVYFILSPITVFIVLLLIRLGIKSKLFLAIFLLLYLYIAINFLNKVLTAYKVQESIFENENSYYENSRILYYLLTFGLLILILILSVLSLFFLTPLVL